MNKSKHNPLIILPGINHSQTFLYDSYGHHIKDRKGNDLGGTFIFPDTDTARLYFPEVKREIFKSIAASDPAKVKKAVYKLVSESLWPQKCDSDGNHVNNLITQRNPHSMATFSDEELRWLDIMVPMKELPDIIGRDKIYFFTFNLVGDPLKSAEELDSYIQNVKSETGCEKVTLLPISLGGTILTAYLECFGHRDIDNIVNAVACLNGTDIVADLFEKNFNMSSAFIHHVFPADISEEIAGKKSYGYIIGSLLHILPDRVIKAVLESAVDAALDTVMINCPQMWAMLPSYRYDDLADRYLSDASKKKLKEKTDRFQTARLNLKKNILSAVADGVKVSFISGSNLSFGEPEYRFFEVVSSTGRYNTDGIINLSSTTLGATGVPNKGTLGKNYRQKKTNPEYPDYSYISPDNKIDVSTALLPDSTWIFLNQHHEVGRNDAVLNLFISLILGRIDDVHSDPVNYPQFNFSSNTQSLRRHLLPEAERLLGKIENGTLPRDAGITEKLRESVAQARAVLDLTVADSERAKKSAESIKAVLSYFTEQKKDEQQSIKDAVIEKISKKISLGLLKK
ncbi:MAG: hypothetical protein K6F64_02405 [Clostridia bacterium]|nr:hypothetical protein [Clostridia bacterium]